MNHWDNLDGTIERGYAGSSIFFANGAVVDDLSRVRAYARLLASVGINGCTINNVNADVRVLMPAFLPQLARVAAVFRPSGIRLSISVDFSSPRRTGGLDVRGLHRPAWRRHAGGHHQHPLRAWARVLGTERVGAVASGRREGRRHGSHGCNRHGLHRAHRKRECGVIILQ